MINYWLNKIFNGWTVLAIFVAAIIIISLQSYYSSGIEIDGVYYEYNNYVIFKYSFKHLIDYKDLYIYYMEDHWDLYKYTPTFALFMAPMYYLHDVPGLMLWNAINTLILLYGIWLLPFEKKEWKIWILIIIFIELITSIQNSQANGLMAGLTILSFSLLERKKYALGVFLIVFSVFVKPFSVFAFAFLLFHPNKIKNIAYAILFTLILLALPLLVVSFEQLIFLYKNWFHLLTWDLDESTGISVQGVMNVWLHFYPAKNTTLFIGLLLLFIPLLQYKKWTDFNFKINYLSYLLIWMIIFNHKAESPTFIIAMCGVAIWFVNAQKNVINISLLTLSVVFTVLSATDVFPPIIKEQYLRPYLVKVIPCILIFFKILFDLFNSKNRKTANENYAY